MKGEMDIGAPWEASVEHRCQVGADFGWTMMNALQFATLREFDHGTNISLARRMISSHHEHYFLDGLEKLGLDREASDAVRCAKYHYFSNLLGGLNMGYAEESARKAWVFYAAPFLGRFFPGVGIAAFTPEYMIETMRGWHGRNGVTLGNPRLGFVLTHLVYRGDPYDAGYFVEEERELRAEERLRIRWGEEAPPITRPALDPKVWPPERFAKAVRNNGVGYMGSQLWALMKGFGLERAAAICGHALRIVLFHRPDDFREALGVPAQASFRSALFWQRLLTCLGDAVALSPANRDHAVVSQTTSRLHDSPDFHAPGETGFPAAYEDAAAEAWRDVAAFLEPGISVTMTASLARGDGRWEWTFRR